MSKKSNWIPVSKKEMKCPLSLRKLRKTKEGRMIKAGQLFRFARRERVYLRDNWNEECIESFLNADFIVAITARTCDVAIQTMTRIRDGFEPWSCEPVTGKYELANLNHSIAEFEWVKAEYESDHPTK